MGLHKTHKIFHTLTYEKYNIKRFKIKYFFAFDLSKVFLNPIVLYVGIKLLNWVPHEHIIISDFNNIFSVFLFIIGVLLFLKYKNLNH